MSKYIAVMYKIKIRLPLQTYLQIYQTLVQLHLNLLVINFELSLKLNLYLENRKKAKRSIKSGYVNRLTWLVDWLIRKMAAKSF